jgi:16S rRNA (cytosine1402-N4)-methyltransferase
MRSLQAGGEVWQGVEPRARPVTKKPITASDEEIKFNPRSRSAKLRAIEKELDR